MPPVIAIDPGTDLSAVLTLDGEAVTEAQHMGNPDLRDWLFGHDDEHDYTLAIEMIASYGMPVGREVFETCVWIGRFVEAWGGPFALVYRRDVKLHLCNSPRAKDGNVRQALIDRFGGTRRKAVGVKAAQGPLYGISKHLWAALGVAVTYQDGQAANA